MNKKIKKSLFYSIVDGSFWSIMFGMGERYLAAFAVFLKATNLQLGLLTSLPLLIGSILQYFSMKLTDYFGSRKRFTMTTATIQAFIWIPILLSFFMGKMSVNFLILFAIIYFVSGMIAVPAWNSWIGDLVPAEIRGKYFAKRNRITGLVIFLSFVLGGIILDLFKDGSNKQYIGFIIIFLAAMFARFFSVMFLGKKYEPKFKIRKRSEFSFFDFIKQARFRNYGLFVFFLTLMNFAVYITAPYFVAYMLYDLEFSYFTYMIVVSAAFIAKYLSLPVWGELTDTYGTKKILALTGFIIPILPVLWIFSKSVSYLMGVQILGGIFWAGFELSSFNFVFDTTTPEKRPRCVSYYNMINGVLIFLGSIAGSIIIKYNTLFWSKYYLAFIVSGSLRFLIALYFLPKLREVREVADIKYQKVFLKASNMIITQSFNNLTFLLLYPRRFKLVKDTVSKVRNHLPGSNRH